MEEQNKQTKNGAGKKITVILLISFILVGLAGGGWWWYQAMRYVSTDDARISGTIINVSAKIPGRVVEVFVKEGDRVKAGQIIARLDPKDILAQKAQAEAAVSAAKAVYDQAWAGARQQEIGAAAADSSQAQATAENARKNYVRMQQLYTQGAISAAQLDNAEAAYKVASQAASAKGEQLSLVQAGAREETIRAALAQVKQAEAAVQAVNTTLDNAAILAPTDGTVAQKSVNAGEVVSAGQPLFNVVNDSDLWVDAKIEETKLGKVTVGQKVDYTIDTYPDQVFTGTVYEVGSAASSVFALIPTENSSGSFTKVTQRIPIKITLPEINESNKNLVFRPGMSVIIKVHTS